MTEENKIPSENIIDDWMRGVQTGEEPGIQPDSEPVYPIGVLGGEEPFKKYAGVMGIDVEMVRVDPRNDEAFLKLSGEAGRMVLYAGTFTIASVSDVSQAAQDLSLIANLTKALEDLRRTYTVPLNDHLYAINAAFKAISVPVGEAWDTLKAKIKAFNLEQEELQAAAEKAQRLREEALKLEAELTQKTGEIFEPLPAAPIVTAAPVDKLYTEVGSLGFRKVPHWEIENESLIPRDYFTLDVKKLDKVVKAGLDKIPGLRIWIEKEPIITPKKADGGA